MSHNEALLGVFIFLLTVCVVVPLARRFRLGSVLGYLVAGVLIGPSGFGFVYDAGQIMHFAEFGVIMMLFLIGLELEPAILWRLRRTIAGLGGAQMAVTGVALTGIGMTLGWSWQASLVCGTALALSSTALVLQMLEEKGLLQTSAGESAFAVLLFQDIAVIPLLAVMPLLADGAAAGAGQVSALPHVPGWLHALIVTGAIALIVVGARHLSHRVFHVIAKTNLREVFIATSLALILGITLLMQLVGLSPALGAFVAGLAFANSSYRHTLETDIQPFKGLLLGLFFISIGMGMDLTLLTREPVHILIAVAGLMGVKSLLLYGIGRRFGLHGGQSVLFAFALAQGGEFAFVLFQYAGGLSILDSRQAAFLTLTVALSIAATPFLMLFNDRVVVPRFMSRLPEQPYDNIHENGDAIIIAGYGRFGQIIGRFLSAQGIKITVLEKDPDQIEMLRKFGHRGYFGDASRLDLLRSAGADRAKLLIVVVDDPDKCLEIVQLARRNFPDLKIFARARNRRHAYELSKAGVDYFRRETFDSSLTMAQEVMRLLGASDADARRKAMQFMEHDEKTLWRSFEFFDREPELISFSRQASGELERILKEDVRPETSSPGTS